MIVRMQQRHDTAANWVAANPVLAVGEIGYDQTNDQTRIGDGTHHWIDLPIREGVGVPDATETTKGKVELATLAETVTGTDTFRATTPAGVKAALDALPPATVTDTALLNANQRAETEKDRALRTWNVAALNAATTAVDIVVPTSDSIGAGAFTSDSSQTFQQVMLARLRKALQPATIVGGSGYYGYASQPQLVGAGFISSTGTVTLRTTYGAGLKAYELSPAATLTEAFVGTTTRVRYRKGAAFGTFTYTVDGGPAQGPINANAAVDSTGELVIGPLASGVHTIVFTAVGTTGLIGEMNYNGDETAGIRIGFDGSHSGYGATNFVSNTAWEDDLSFVQNPKLAILPIGSNDWYLGRTVAQATADINTIIADVRAKYGATISIVLVAYYDRPHGSAVVPWSDYVDMYRSIAAGDDWITLFDAGPLFGPLLNDTDDRNGLTTAVVGDYVHPTASGHKLLGNALADFLMPKGTAGANSAASVTAASVTDAANGKQVYTDLGPGGGAINWSIVPLGAYSITATSNLTQAAGASMPPVTAGKTAHHYFRIVQDATGGRTFTPAAGIKVPYPIVLQTAPGAVDVLHYFYDGAEWVIESMTNPGVSAPIAAAISAASTGGAASAVVTQYTGANANTVYPIPATAKALRFRLLGSGGGAGSGCSGAVGTIRNGGGGGSGGGYTEWEVSVAELLALGLTNLYVDCGLGGAGGAAATSANGNAGAAGTAAAIKTAAAVASVANTLAFANGGGPGQGGTPTTGTGGTALGFGRANGAAGASASGTGTVGVAGPAAQGGANGGASGGGLTAVDAQSAGGAGSWATGRYPSQVNGGGAGGGNGSNGNESLTLGYGGAGGGGGSRATGGAGGNGGNGGKGVGGSGGGASVTGQPSGKGGDGGAGFVEITAIF